MNRVQRNIINAFLLVTLGGLAGLSFAQEKSIVVASTTSTEQSGLFAYLLPIFKSKSGIDVKVVVILGFDSVDLHLGMRAHLDASNHTHRHPEF